MSSSKVAKEPVHEGAPTTLNFAEQVYKLAEEALTVHESHGHAERLGQLHQAVESIRDLAKAEIAEEN